MKSARTLSSGPRRHGSDAGDPAAGRPAGRRVCQGAGSAVVTGGTAAVVAGIDAGATAGADVAGSVGALVASGAGGFVRTATIPEYRLYGHPTGSTVGTGGRSTIDWRTSPGST